MSLRLRLAALIIIGLLAPAAESAGRTIREWPKDPNAPRLSDEDIALVRSALARLETGARDERGVVPKIKSLCLVLFVLRGEETAWMSEGEPRKGAGETGIATAIAGILGSVSDIGVKDAAVRALGRMDAEIVRPHLPLLLGLLEEHNVLVEGGTEDWAPNLYFKRELVRLIGELTGIEVDVSTTKFENPARIRELIDQAEAASGVRRIRPLQPQWLVQSVRQGSSPPPLPAVSRPAAAGWGLVAAASAVSLLLGFILAALLFRFRRRKAGGEIFPPPDGAT